jgi:histidinol-phosphate phosphatase family protein
LDELLETNIVTTAIASQAVILVGDAEAGASLLTLDDDRVFLDELIFQIARHGYDDILLLAAHSHEQLSARYSRQTHLGAKLRVTEMDSAAERLAPTFLFARGDALFDVNLRRLDAALLQAPEALGVLALRRVADADRSGRVSVEEGRILSFAGESAEPAGASGLVSGGNGLLRRDALDGLGQPLSSIESQVYPRLAAEGRLVAQELFGYFLDLAQPGALARAREELARRRRRPALFLDRDGVLNHDAGYTHKVEDLRWIPGAIDTIRRANDMGAFVIVVTNQAGVAHGYYGTEDVDRFHAAMAAQLAAAGAHIDAFYLCPYHPEATIAAWRHPNHPDRKPEPGMILRALAEWPIEASSSVLIGDRESDVAAARAAGVSGLLFKGDDLSSSGVQALSLLAPACKSLTPR